ncbi:CNVH-domain-containing protein [Periconia macrospinosa]|uniref:CNVH-domain-containing protein n=1 Tax=Periconia macrospinosa TaxID=97972 RepID=A0A2V1DEG0_9PLEO|nr:CNVH-domain-containing protein [Periconia macrospinosa]
MSFHESAEDIRVDDNHILRARLRNFDGDFVDAEFNLDEVLGNQEGQIHWDGVNFSQSVDNVEFHIEGGGSVPVLRCFCRTSDGQEFARDVNLAERIKNDNGSFVYRGMSELSLFPHNGCASESGSSSSTAHN